MSTTMRAMRMIFDVSRKKKTRDGMNEKTFATVLSSFLQFFSFLLTLFYCNMAFFSTAERRRPENCHLRFSSSMVRRNLLLNSIFAITIRCRSFRITWRLEQKREENYIFFKIATFLLSLFNFFLFPVLSMVVSLLCNFFPNLSELVRDMKIEI